MLWMYFSLYISFGLFCLFCHEKRNSYYLLLSYQSYTKVTTLYTTTLNQSIRPTLLHYTTTFYFCFILRHHTKELPFIQVLPKGVPKEVLDFRSRVVRQLKSLSKLDIKLVEGEWGGKNRVVADGLASNLECMVLTELTRVSGLEPSLML